MSKHTPGPWKVIYHFNVVSSKNRGVATTGGYANNIEDSNALHAESVANAKLIAAAPDLLEALELALDALAFHEGSLLDFDIQIGNDAPLEEYERARGIHQKARAAIKKATE